MGGEAGTMRLEGAPELTQDQFDKLRELLQRHFGIKLSDEKKALMIGRLGKVLKERGLDGFEAYYRRLTADGTGRELSVLIDNMSTNHTFFNREGEHFEFFAKRALPEARDAALARGVKELRVWCAAASTGEEPYNLAMIMMEVLGAGYAAWDAGLLATDISDRALSAAKAGIYDAERIAALPEGLARKYFRPCPGGFQAIPELRREITFRRFNLMHALPFRKPFDVIFCRNVMIYFDGPTKDALADRLYEFTRPNGYLVVSHSETLGRGGRFAYVGPGIYRRPA